MTVGAHTARTQGRGKTGILRALIVCARASATGKEYRIDIRFDPFPVREAFRDVFRDG